MCQNCSVRSKCDLVCTGFITSGTDVTDDVIVVVVVIAVKSFERNDLNEVNFFVEKDLESFGLEPRVPVLVPDLMTSLGRNLGHVAGLIDQVQPIGDLVSRRIEGGSVWAA